MTGRNVARLLAVASEALGSPLDQPAMAELPDAALGRLLGLRNGFYAFESALHVFHSDSARGDGSLGAWNGESGWRREYGDLATGLTFFAEDVFGGQFALRSGRVLSFDPETGDTEELASSLEDWAGKILDDYNILTGYPLAHSWQQGHGRLSAGQRLLPIVPFVLGGAFATENLRVVDAAEGMRIRGQLATQIRDLPDGTEVDLDVP